MTLTATCSRSPTTYAIPGLVDLAAVQVLVLWIPVFVLSSIPLVDQLFALTPLRQPTDHVTVGVAVLAWAFTTVFVGRVAPLQRLWQPAGALHSK